MTDPIADMLTRIRNASMVKKSEVVLPMSKLKFQIAKILEKTGYLEKVEEVVADKALKSSSFASLRLVLKYREDKQPFITSLKRISKPGLRVYVDKDHIPQVLNSYGIAILSTSSGLMTNKEAFAKKVGGEVLCEIY